MRWITALAVALVAAVSIVVVSAGGAAPSATVSALSNGAPASIDKNAQAALEDAGFAVKDADAVSVPAPSGEGSWVLVPGTDGGACLVVPDGAAACGSDALLAKSGVINATPDAAASAALGLPDRLDPSEMKAGVVPHGATDAPQGAVTVRGLVSDDVTAAAAVASAGELVGKVATVTNNVFELDGVPLEQAVSVQLTHADGSSSDITLR